MKKREMGGETGKGRPSAREGKEGKKDKETVITPFLISTPFISSFYTSCAGRRQRAGQGCVRSRIPRSPIRTFHSTWTDHTTMAAPCFSQLHHTLLRSSTGPRTVVRAFSFSAPSFYSRAKNSSTNAPTTIAAGSGTNPWKNKANSNNSSPYVPPPNSVLAYVGPYAASLRQCKSVAFVFGACGCIAVPSTLFLGNTEHFLAIMGNLLVVLFVFLLL